VQLTINGSNLDLLERPKMTVSVNISENGIRTASYSVTVRWSHVCIIQWVYVTFCASIAEEMKNKGLSKTESTEKVQVV